MAQKQPQFIAPLVFDNGRPRISRVMIANRGEIACRVIQTCRKLAITSVIIYTDADSKSPFVRSADVAVCVGSAEKQPYLDIDLLVKIARDHAVDAIHPGYGYLSENAGFAKAVREAGMLFIGPSPASIAALGDKREAKIYLVANSTVPLVPGYAGLGQDPEALQQEASKIGYPVMIKASAGGGGKGMRIVHQEADFQEALERCTSEAARLFGSSHCLIEKYIQFGKHVEIQIFGDGQTAVSFLDRECSVQRRNQKVIEESPCLWLDAQMRDEMSQAAMEIASLLAYESAGTVEFIVDTAARKFYFLEVNTRIQVEHPITEEVMGIDLVALQIYVSSGGRLSALSQLQHIKQTGHAIEVRLCAEDPFNDFKPCIGTINSFQTASDVLGVVDPDVRYDLGVVSGSQVTIHFDSMVSKVIVWAPDRSQATRKMLHVLRNTICFGLVTNQVFLQRILESAAFKAIDYSTSLIPSILDDLTAPAATQSARVEDVIVAGIIHEKLKLQTQQRHSAFRSIPSSFRNQRKDRHLSSTRVVRCDLSTIGIPATEDIILRDQGPGSYELTYFDQDVQVSQSEQEQFFNKEGGPLVKRYYAAVGSQSRQTVRGVAISDWQFKAVDAWFHGRLMVSNESSAMSYTFATAKSGDFATAVFLSQTGSGFGATFTVSDVLAWSGKLDEKANSGQSSDSRISVCPMPSKILQVLAHDGSHVKAGSGLLVLESMKTEIRITAAAEGIVSMKVKTGEVHPEGTILCEILQEK